VRLRLLAVSLRRLDYAKFYRDRALAQSARPKARQQQEACSKRGSEDGGRTVLRNVYGLVPEYTASHPRRWHCSPHILFARVEGGEVKAVRAGSRCGRALAPSCTSVRVPSSMKKETEWAAASVIIAELTQGLSSAQ
jgi:hypothetical protein